MWCTMDCDDCNDTSCEHYVEDERDRRIIAATRYINKIERIIKEQPSANIEDDKWLLEELDAVKYLLEGENGV